MLCGVKIHVIDVKIYLLTVVLYVLQMKKVESMSGVFCHMCRSSPITSVHLDFKTVAEGHNPGTFPDTFEGVLMIQHVTAEGSTTALDKKIFAGPPIHLVFQVQNTASNHSTPAFVKQKA